MDSVATSKPFKFLVGADKTEYTIHSALVAHQSTVLSALVNGSFRESSECSVTWDDVDEVVFNSFWQFVYTGDYDTPEPLPPTEEAPKPLGFASVDAPPPSAIKIKKKKKRGSSRRISLWLDFVSSWDYPPEPFDVDVALKDHANPLMHHAKVYTLADRYAITRLTGLSRLNLHQELIDLAGKGEDYNNVVELVRYTFEELVPDQLRDLVVHFSACVVEHLWKIEEFQELLGEYGILSKALVGTMLLRLDENVTPCPS
ncbi:uncharacterized protein BKA55DRAFT_529836 [Fusarium redolens]|uniref:BTB domain-containing protein n=1 Tax=Fusarium redolens TaxID=48865 RepID=A0A9P9JKF9_FUSRE|nr:uncharacterized protein BKA55DRAFT_529836 [Fusarium redolens]KAH7207871.1 hypothetical protein BKA55DRAFT_529836 [Fusarium redolens]